MKRNLFRPPKSGIASLSAARRHLFFTDVSNHESPDNGNGPKIMKAGSVKLPSYVLTTEESRGEPSTDELVVCGEKVLPDKCKLREESEVNRASGSNENSSTSTSLSESFEDLTEEVTAEETGARRKTCIKKLPGEHEQKALFSEPKEPEALRHNFPVPSFVESSEGI
ncbi:unnamed protein product [Gongylonema pulchrum]|uniref:Uncharacterized protein n=1 Tax=Gongylonema pulchrum TaxID=637853 RepID=A0A3P6QAE9_9BILA|nr:unnamed protein product [Gongylonema pulchrum]